MTRQKILLLARQAPPKICEARTRNALLERLSKAKYVCLCSHLKGKRTYLPTVLKELEQFEKNVLFLAGVLKTAITY
tara:strand:- start:623 stop:853 length:231 start_codon:yes stop_codon:yes gene_type:complete